MNTPHQHAAEVAMTFGAKATSGMTHGGAAVAVVGGMTLNEIAIVVGIVVSVLGLFGNWCINWYWKQQEHRLARERHEWDRRQRFDCVECDKDNQGGAVRKSLVAAMLAAGTLVAASPALIGFLERWEGRENVAYADALAGNLPTVCAGLTNHTSPVPVVIGDYWSDEMCAEVERMVVTKTQLKLADCLRVPVSQPVFDALSSHAHNVGAAGTCASRAMALINAGRTREGCEALAHGPDGKPVWSYVTVPGGGKQFVRGLYGRRLAERDMCLKGIV